MLSISRASLLGREQRAKLLYQSPPTCSKTMSDIARVTLLGISRISDICHRWSIQQSGHCHMKHALKGSSPQAGRGLFSIMPNQYNQAQSSHNDHQAAYLTSPTRLTEYHSHSPPPSHPTTSIINLPPAQNRHFTRSSFLTSSSGPS